MVGSYQRKQLVLIKEVCLYLAGRDTIVNTHLIHWQLLANIHKKGTVKSINLFRVEINVQLNFQS